MAGPNSDCIEHFNRLLHELANAGSSGPPASAIAEFDSAASDLLEETIAEDLRGRQFLMRIVAEAFTSVGDDLRAISWLEMLRADLVANADPELYAWAMVRLAETYASADRLDKAAALIDELLASGGQSIDAATEAQLRIYRAVHCLQQTDIATARIDLDRAEALLGSLGADPQATELVHALQAKSLVMAGRYEEGRALLATVTTSSASCEAICDEAAQYLGVAAGPLKVPCAHRVLERALGHFSFMPGPHPRWSEPNPAATELRFNSRLSTEAGRECLELEERISGFPIAVGGHMIGRPSQDSPAASFLTTINHYVKDVAEFQQAWSLFKQERSVRGELVNLDARQARLRRGRGGSDLDQSHLSAFQWAEYVELLVRQAQLAAEAQLAERFRAFSMFAANFLELGTNDPALALLAWMWRCELLGEACRLGAANQRECSWHFGWGIENILACWRLIDRNKNVDPLLAKVSLCLIQHHSLLPGARNPDAVRGLLDELIEHNQGRDAETAVNLLLVRSHLIDCLGRPAEALDDVDSAMRQKSSISTPVRLDLELGNRMLRRRAAIRLSRRAKDQPGLVSMLGPFAPFIGPEIGAGGFDSDWQDHLPEDVRNSSGRSGARGAGACLGFADGSVLVMQEDVGAFLDETDVMVHEMAHALRRVMGQQLRTGDGQWLKVKRDVPTASAQTFLSIFDGGACDRAGMPPTMALTCALIRWGMRQAEEDPDGSGAHIAEALSYFDDMELLESDASYPCGAILAGMALGLLNQSRVRASAYLSQLSVRDHQDALIAARLGEDLSF